MNTSTYVVSSLMLFILSVFVRTVTFRIRSLYFEDEIFAPQKQWLIYKTKSIGFRTNGLLT